MTSDLSDSSGHWPAPRPVGPVSADGLAARHQVADQPGPAPRGALRRPQRRTTSPALARHPADGHRADRAGRRRRRLGRRLGDHARSLSGPGRRSTAAWPARSCGSSRPSPALADGHGRLRRRPAHAPAAGGSRCSPRCAPSACTSTTAAEARSRSRCMAPARSAGGTVTIDASASSQFVSALLLAGARYDEGVDVRHDGKPVPSLPHIEMTVATLREHGVEVGRQRRQPLGRRARTGRRRRPRRSSPTSPTPRRSWRSAAVTGGTRHRARLADEHHAARRRAARDPDPDGLRRRAGRHRADRHRCRRGSHGLDLDLHDVGELTPAIAALCALADSPSHLRGVAHIRGHETDRLAALATELGRPRRRRHRARRRALDPARTAARRRLPHLRRPPDGPRRRDPRPRRRRRAGREHRHHVPRPSPTSPAPGRTLLTERSAG